MVSHAMTESGITVAFEFECSSRLPLPKLDTRHAESILRRTGCSISAFVDQLLTVGRRNAGGGAAGLSNSVEPSMRFNTLRFNASHARSSLLLHQIRARRRTFHPIYIPGRIDCNKRQ